MTDVTDLSARRWELVEDPNKHEAAAALRAALRALEDPEKGAPDHIIILFGRNCEDGATGTRFFNSGSFTYHGQIGLLEEGKMMIRETA